MGVYEQTELAFWAPRNRESGSPVCPRNPVHKIPCLVLAPANETWLTGISYKVLESVDGTTTLGLTQSREW